MRTRPLETEGFLQDRSWTGNHLRVASRCSAFLMFCVAILAAAGSAAADDVVLRNGGRLENVRVEEQEQDGKPLYKITMQNGTELILDRSTVRVVVTASPEEEEYRKLRAEMADTIEAHEKMADYCVEHRMSDERRYHLWQIIRHDPDHEGARRSLGYTNRDGRWMTQEQYLRSQGYVRVPHEGWRLPQEVEIMQAREQREAALIEWRRQLGFWQDWLGKRNHAEAVASIRSIKDPVAIGPIVERWSEATSRDERRLWIEALENIGTQAISQALARIAIDDEDEGNREYALRVLAKDPAPGIARYFMIRLDPAKGSPAITNRAARGLEVLGADEATRHLIEVVVTEYQVTEGGGGGGGGQRINLGMQSGGGGSFNFGGKPRTRIDRYENAQVVKALAELTGVNFGYNKQAWLNWFVQENSDPHVDLRRRDEGP